MYDVTNMVAILNIDNIIKKQRVICISYVTMEKYG